MLSDCGPRSEGDHPEYDQQSEAWQYDEAEEQQDSLLNGETHACEDSPQRYEHYRCGGEQDENLHRPYAEYAPLVHFRALRLLRLTLMRMSRGPCADNYSTTFAVGSMRLLAEWLRGDNRELPL